MSFDPYGYEAEEARDAARFYTGPDDPGRPDPSEYMDPPAFMAFSETLDCGHRVEASEESGGFDEVGHVTESMVRDALAFKIRLHDCAVTEDRLRRASDRHGSGPLDGPAAAGPF